MEQIRKQLEKVLEEHQRESGLHMIGGRARLVERLLTMLEAVPVAAIPENTRMKPTRPSPR